MQLLPVISSTANFVRNTSTPLDTSITLSMEIWHKDIIEILKSLRNRSGGVDSHGNLQFEFWVTDLLYVPVHLYPIRIHSTYRRCRSMKRLSVGKHWSLFCPAQVQGLTGYHGSDFEEVYTQFEDAGFGQRIDARALWLLVMEAQIHSKSISLIYKDHHHGEYTAFSDLVLRFTSSVK